jgi:hypothetical protein
MAEKAQSFLWQLVQGTCDEELLTTLLTAIPKPDRDSSDPAQLRPISVTSIWYRIISRVFVLRLNRFIP